jgi:chemotaxis protein methyltransferase CheR
MNFALSDELYERFCTMLLSRAGLYYPAQRRSDLGYALSHAARAAGHADLAALADAVSRDQAAWDELIAELTIGETYFFRNGAQFTALRQLILPSLIEARRHSHYLRLWSAGCATGEEPYSLAITLGETLPDYARWQVSILGTDINQRFLQRAREALYGAWSFRETPPEVRERYFTPEGGRWRLRPEIRRQVVFMPLNLAEPVYPAAINGTLALDIIFCRNVTIYFDEATTRQVAQRFFDALAPGGWLVIGHAEPHLAIYRQFETHNVPGAVLYRKPLSAPVFRSSVSALQSLPAAVSQPAAPLLAKATQSALRPMAPQQAVVEPAAPAPPPPISIDERLATARTAADRGEWAAALEQATQVTTLAPLDVRAHYLLGQIHEHADARADALTAYRRSVYLDPGFVAGMLGMARIWQQDGCYADAGRALRGAKRRLERYPPDDTLPDAEGATVAEVLAYIHAQLHAMGQDA